jgi:serine phosphatase RsbU (regulator of sigma subunit)
LGIDDYITKPVDPDHLIQVTHRIITRSRQLRHHIIQQLDDSIHAALTPSLPDSIGRYDLALRFQSAGIGGGDLVLHRRLMDGDLIIMADILGHGVQAKFYAHAYAGYISGMLTRFLDLSDPARLLADFNQAVCQDRLLGSSSITSIALHLGDDGRVSMAGAGHPWPLLYRHGQSPVVEKVNVGGVLLGLSDETLYQSQMIELHPGDQLVFFTDGLYELGDDWSRPDCGYEQLKSVIRKYADKSSSILADKIMAHQLGQKNQSLGDDITLAIVEVSPNQTSMKS